MSRKTWQIRGPQTLVFLVFLGVLVATYYCYSPGLGGPFVLDDQSNLAHLKVNSLTWSDIAAKIFDSDRLGSLSRSVTSLSFALTNYFNGYSPYPYKYQNLLIHLLNGALLFWLLLLLGRRKGGTADDSAPWLAFACVAIWLLHPLQVSTVLYAVQRLVLLSALFVLAALITYVKGRALAETRPVAGLAVATTGIALFGTLGLLSKENAALLPVFVVLIEVFFFRLAFRSDTQRRLFLALLGVFVLLPILAGIAFALWNWPSLIAGYSGRDFDLPERLMSQLHALGLYLRLILIPVPTAMSLWHDDFPVTRVFDWPTASLALLFAGLFAAAFTVRRRQPEVAFGIVWFFACHLLESTLIPLELVFEHRNYLALMGPVIALVFLIRAIFSTKFLTPVLPPVLAATLLLLGLNTAARAFVWADKELMVRTEYAVRPESGRVLTELIALEMSRGQLEAAFGYVQKLEALGLPQAGPQLTHLRMLCNSTAIPAALRDGAYAKLRDGILSAYATGELGQIVADYLAKRCPAISQQQIYALTTAATQNQNVHQHRILCIAHYHHTRLVISTGNLDLARTAFGEALEQCAHHAPTLFDEVARDLVHDALSHLGGDAVLELMNSASAINPDIAARLVAWSQAGEEAIPQTESAGID